MGIFHLKVTGNLKTFIKIMVSLKFHDVNDSTTLELYTTNQNVLYIKIIQHNEEFANEMCHIELDKSTAIKLSKEIRKQIALLD